MRRLLVEAVRHHDVIGGIRVLARAAPDELEDELPLLPVGIRHRLHEHDLAGLDDDLAEELLAAQDLDGGRAFLVLVEVPVQILLVVEVAVGGAGADDAVRVAG